MRLLVTCPGDRLTGVARTAAALAAAWQRSGRHEVTVAVHGPGEAIGEFRANPELCGRVQEVALPTLRKNVTAAARHAVGLWAGTGALMRLIADHQPDVIVGHCIFNVWSAWAATASRVPFVPVLHELPFSYPRPAYFIWQRVVTTHARAIVAVSDAVAHTLPPASAPCTVIPPGIDTRAFADTVDGARLRRRWLRGSRGPLIVCVSHLMPPKGQLDALRAFEEVVRARPTARLVFVGGTNGVAAQAAFLAELAQEAQRRGFASHVVFAGQLSRPQEALAAADVVVYPSHGESFGLVPLEACAMGKWLVASDVGVVPALARAGAPVIAVPPQRPHELAAALLDALGRGGATPFTHERWTMDGAARAYESVFARL